MVGRSWTAFLSRARKAVMTKHGTHVDALRIRSVEAAGERADVRDWVRCLQPGTPDDRAPLSKHPCTPDEPSPAGAEFCTFLLRLGRLTCPGTTVRRQQAHHPRSWPSRAAQR